MQLTPATLVVFAVLVSSCAAQSNNAFWGDLHWNSTLVFNDHIVVKSSVLSVVEEKITFPPRGVIDYRQILAIRAYDQKTNGNGATATIYAGGIHNTTVTLLLKSKRGHGIDFRVEMYTLPRC